MVMEVILMQDVQGLGKEGDVVKVADGYGRNYLVPRKIGAPVTEATRRRLAKLRQERAVAYARELDTSKTVLTDIEKNSYTIAAKAGPEGKLFGAVTNAMIADALAAQGFAIDKHKVLLEEPLKELGVYDVKIKLHPEVEATVKVWIVEE